MEWKKTEKWLLATIWTVGVPKFPATNWTAGVKIAGDNLDVTGGVEIESYILLSINISRGKCFNFNKLPLCVFQLLYFMRNQPTIHVFSMLVHCDISSLSNLGKFNNLFYGKYYGPSKFFSNIVNHSILRFKVNVCCLDLIWPEVAGSRCNIP